MGLRQGRRIQIAADWWVCRFHCWVAGCRRGAIPGRVEGEGMPLSLPKVSIPSRRGSV
jgi:hypothetical protein